MKKKQRLDITLYEQGLAPSREKARAMIMAGEVSVDGKVVDKPGTRVPPSVRLNIKLRPRYVSRGGEKIAHALETFSVPVNGRFCADVGASTGGFTDCLLQYGAARVYAIDVGYGQLDYELRQNERVVVMERTNARYIERLPEPVSLVVIDASFISLRLLLPVIAGWLTPEADIIALVKPQFEASKGDVGKGGVVRKAEVHIRVLREILSFAHQNYAIRGLTRSPLTGPAGNVEFLAWFGWGHSPGVSPDIDALIAAAIDR
jgi:23S rRNA (cytidine1920-2'-O)/16S rRNA (cytidine1409-2'-O)-methyltransferase